MTESNGRPPAEAKSEAARNAKVQAVGNWLVLSQFIMIAAIALMPKTFLPLAWDVPFSFIGFGLVGLGVILVLMAITALGPSLSAHPAPRSRSGLVTDGLYRWMRHPIYTGLLAATLGVAISNGVWPQIVIWVALLSLLIFKSRFEESLLREKYPNYEAYAAKTGRFLPRVFRRRK